MFILDLLWVQHILLYHGSLLQVFRFFNFSFFEANYCEGYIKF